VEIVAESQYRFVIPRDGRMQVPGVAFATRALIPDRPQTARLSRWSTSRNRPASWRRRTRYPIPPVASADKPGRWAGPPMWAWPTASLFWSLISPRTVVIRFERVLSCGSTGTTTASWSADPQLWTDAGVRKSG